MAEGDRVAVEREQPGGDALVDRAGVGADRLAEQPQLGRAGDDRRELDDRARRGRDAVDAQGDGVADARRHAAAGGGREHLGDEERVAAGDRVQVGRIAPRPLGEQRDRRRGQRLGRDAHDALARQRGEHAPHLGALRAPSGRQVRIRHPGERTRRRPSSATRSSVASSAQCRSSTTSDRGGRELVERGGEHVLAAPEPSSAASSGPPAWRATSRSGPIGARRDQRVARAPQDAPRGQGAAHVGDQRGLADPASPATTATRPAPRESAIAASRTLRSPSRSRSSTPRPA